MGEHDALKMTEYNLVSGGAPGEGPVAPVAPIKHLKVREEFADLANDRARLRIAETQQLLFHAVKTGNESEVQLNHPHGCCCQCSLALALAVLLLCSCELPVASMT